MPDTLSGAGAVTAGRPPGGFPRVGRAVHRAARRMLMLRRLLLVIAASFATVSLASAQTAEDIVAKHVAARGGMEKLKAVKTIRMTGTMTAGPGIEAPITIEMKRPKNTRLEFTLQGLTGVQAYDGTTAWAIMPFQGKKDPEALPAEQAKIMDEQADFDGQLIDYKEKGHTVELVGKEQVEGTDAYKLKATNKDGEVQYHFLDAEYFLEIRTETSRTIRGTQMEFESSIGDYKEVGGLMFPHSIESGPKGSPQRQKLTISKIELNPDIDEARFKMPAVTAAPAPPK
jgi:outer membrane lipoprotein-sorting protein